MASLRNTTPMMAFCSRILHCTFLILILVILPHLLICVSSTPLRVLPFGDSITTCCHECQVQRAVVPKPYWPYLAEGLRPWRGYVVTLHDILVRHGLDGAVTFVGRKSECMRNSSKVQRVATPGWELRYEGYYGNTARQLLRLFPGALNATRPDVVLLHAGTNDVIDPKAAAKRPGSQLAIRALRSIVNTALAPGSTVRHVFIARIIPLVMWNRRFVRFGRNFTAASLPDVVSARERGVRDLNAAIDKTFSHPHYRGRVTVVDMHTNFSAVRHLHGDGLHPNEAGELRLAWRWFCALIPHISGRITNTTLEEMCASHDSLNPPPISPVVDAKVGVGDLTQSDVVVVAPVRDVQEYYYDVYLRASSVLFVCIALVAMRFIYKRQLSF
eukprot:PhM_4_TR9276/c0_g1_i3/m.81312